jgi:hypothetical protein
MATTSQKRKYKKSDLRLRRWRILCHSLRYTSSGTYSGGMVVGFALWKAGLISPIMTDMIRYRSPLMKIKVPADLTDIDADDTLKH